MFAPSTTVLALCLLGSCNLVDLSSDTRQAFLQSGDLFLSTHVGSSGLELFLGTGQQCTFRTFDPHLRGVS
jgi:hypothetical protein